MLRPATPLSILLFLAFGLLLISVLSTPVIKQIPLGSFGGINFGVFGWCKGNSCSHFEIGYDTSAINNNGNENDFDLPSSTRSTLSAILIVHPVAALITLVMLILAVVSHLHSPSHSSRYLLIVFILSIVDLIVCLLSFLIDILLFLPHMAFGSYFVLAATILVALSTLVSCAMRRTIVNRKARKKRINENAEMSGENFYNRQAKESTMPASAPPPMPVVTGANGNPTDKLPVFATFESKDDRVSDERVPLTARSPSDKSSNPAATETNGAETMYNVPPGAGPVPRRPSRDQYGNSVPDNYAMRRPPAEHYRGRGGMVPAGVPPGGYRGRGGGFGPPRGGFGPGPGRGGYGPPGGRGGFGPPSNRGVHGPPPRGYAGPMMRGGRPPPPPPSYEAGPYDRRGSPAAEYAAPYGPPQQSPGPPSAPYGLRQQSPGPPSAPYGARQQSPGPPSAPGYPLSNLNPPAPNPSTGQTYEAYNPGTVNDLPRAESPPPLPGSVNDHAAPIRAPGSPAHSQRSFGFNDSDVDIAGMVGLQQGRDTARQNDVMMSESGRHDQLDEPYGSPPNAWSQNVVQNPSAVPPPLRTPTGNPRPGTGSPRPAPQETSYMEDIDPRFAEPRMVAPPAQVSTPPALETDISYDSIPEGARSPAESERSTFTSISQRGINPNWPGNNAPPSMGGGFRAMPPRRPQPQRDILLDGNPDFMLPGAGGRGGRGPRRGGGAYPAGI